MKDDRLFDRARDDVSILAVAAALGIQVNAHGKALCPAHDDHKPSLSFKDNRCKCFSCQFKGSSIDLVMQVQGLDKWQAAQWILEQPSLSTGTEGTSPKPTRNQPKVEPLPKVDPAPPGFYDDIYSALLDLGQDVETMPADAPGNLITERGIDAETLRTWRVRYYPIEVRRSILHTMQKRFQKEQLTGAGIHKGFNYCEYVFPFLGQGGRVLYVQGRREKEQIEEYGKYCFPRKASNRWAVRPIVYGGHILGSLPDGATVHVCEGITDTLTAASMDLAAVGIPGVGNLNERNAAELAQELRRFRVCFIPDNDGPGQDLEKRFIEAMRRGGVALGPCLRVPEGIKDLSDYWQGVLNDG